ncbi:MAG: tRNA (N6-isopentenyl adenosine(37)-C2)-methylthiotransferase MiaB [Bacteroidales bacterium]|nr:tRNA (N6-isopentenyl adenosine(37)-C2)-methylthiotransferase MiaB [Bacteroidales bacterium]
MNFSDSEIVGSLMADNNYFTIQDISLADVIFINTCSIRDRAEQRVRKRLKEFRSLKKKNPDLIVGVIGCMAERLKDKLFEEEPIIDLIAGPDAYRDLPSLLNKVKIGQKAANILLSAEETYADINPVRLDSNGVSAFISIMRGCQNYCSYCVVPFTRGKERSRDPESIIKEAHNLISMGYKEVTLLGQNVNSYSWNQGKEEINFASLLKMLAEVDPALRLRFATSNPKDLSDELLHTIANHENICNSIHLPVQSGSDKILKLMNRKYTRSWYIDRIKAIREIIPGCAISTDLITGFCSETEEDHMETLSLMEWVGYDFAFMFKYSERPNTTAAEKYNDDVPDSIKGKRLKEIIDLQQKLSLKSNMKDIGEKFEVLTESISKRSDEQLSGRNSQNKVVVFPKENYKTGDYVDVVITDCTTATLIGKPI